jgi:hypothetical protein
VPDGFNPAPLAPLAPLGQLQGILR